jgi:hypothetical protein
LILLSLNVSSTLQVSIVEYKNIQFFPHSLKAGLHFPLSSKERGPGGEVLISTNQELIPTPFS